MSAVAAVKGSSSITTTTTSSSSSGNGSETAVHHHQQQQQRLCRRGAPLEDPQGKSRTSSGKYRTMLQQWWNGIMRSSSSSSSTNDDNSNSEGGAAAAAAVTGGWWRQQWPGAAAFGAAQGQVVAVLWLARVGNAWTPSYPRNNNHSYIMFWTMNAALLVAALCTLHHEPTAAPRRVQLLSRPQTEEWKGWMQWAFIMVRRSSLSWWRSSPYNFFAPSLCSLFLSLLFSPFTLYLTLLLLRCVPLLHPFLSRSRFPICVKNYSPNNRSDNEK